MLGMHACMYVRLHVCGHTCEDLKVTSGVVFDHSPFYLLGWGLSVKLRARSGPGLASPLFWTFSESAY